MPVVQLRAYLLQQQHAVLAVFWCVESKGFLSTSICYHVCLPFAARLEGVQPEHGIA